MRKLIFVLCGLCLAYAASAQEAVDLGLSVKWASCNIGAATETDYGDYFAWGETAPKTEYSLSNYKFWISGEKPEDIQMKKYVTIEDRQNFDNKVYLEDVDDAAAAIWGGGWRIPSPLEWKELSEECDWTWTQKDGRQGYIVKSRKNENSIFLPAAGYKYDSFTQDEGRFGYYWSSMINKMNIDLVAITMFYNWDYKNYFVSRSAGLPVRPVVK